MENLLFSNMLGIFALLSINKTHISSFMDHVTLCRPRPEKQVYKSILVRYSKVLNLSTNNELREWI